MGRSSTLGECPPTGRHVLPCEKEWSYPNRVLREKRWLSECLDYTIVYYFWACWSWCSTCLCKISSLYYFFSHMPLQHTQQDLLLWLYGVIIQDLVNYKYIQNLSDDKVNPLGIQSNTHRYLKTNNNSKTNTKL